MARALSRRDVLHRAGRLTLAAPFLGAACGEGSAALSGVTMGTIYGVRIPALPGGLTGAALKTRIDGILSAIDGLMSTYRSDSEVTRFNAAASTAWFPVSAETASVVAASLRISRLTGGAFDVTVAPLVALWGFGAGAETPSDPSPARIAAAMARVGYRRIEVRTAPPSIRKARADIRIDLSAIAKGYAVDRVAGLLEAAGIADYLVEIGGEIRCRGRNDRGMAWGVGIERPVAGRRSVHGLIRLDAGALATSGDYRQFYVRDGRRLSHIIDPRDGRPVAHGLASVTVVADTAMRADALATALSVLGPEVGRALARRLDLAALFIVREGSGFRELASPVFARDHPVTGGDPWNIS